MLKPLQRSAVVILGGAMALTGMAATPTQADPAADAPPIKLDYRDHGPVETAVAMNAFAVGEWHDGREVMMVQGGTKSWKTVIGVIDPMTGESLHEFRLPKLQQSLSPVTGPDGKLYIPGYPGDYTTTNLMTFDPKTLEVDDLGIGVEGETHIARMQFVGDTLWAGTYPGAHVQSYDTTTGTYTDHGSLDEDEWYARSIAHDGDHTIYVGTEGSGRIVKWDLETGEKIDLEMPPTMHPNDYTVLLLSYQQGFLFGRFGGSADYHAYDTVAQEWVDVLRWVPASMPTDVDPATNRSYFAKNGAGGLHYFDFEQRRFVQEGWPQALSNANAGAGLHLMDLDHPDWPGLTVVGQGRNGGIWRYNPTTKQGVMVPDAELPQSGQLIRALHMGPDGNAYFGMGFNSGLLVRFNPETGEFEKQTPFSTSQVHNHLNASDGSMYIASYSNAGLIRYDPADPYEWGVNPRMITNFGGDRQDRIFGLAEVDGKIVLGTSGQRGQADGLIAVYDPATDAITKHLAPLPGHQITAFETVDGVLYGGTSIVTPGADPVAEESKIFAYDADRQEVLWEVSPLPGNATVSELRARDDGKLWGLTNAGTAFLFDPETREVVMEVEVGPGTVYDGYPVLRHGVDGYMYGANGTMFRLDPETGEVRRFDQPGVAIEQAADGTLYWTDDVSLFTGRMIDETPPDVTASFEGARTVSVTIEADDDISGVASIEYRIGGGDWTAYTDPVTVRRSPGLVMEYRATDEAGNVSDVQTLRLDPGPPGRLPGPPAGAAGGDGD
jgi:outer membrane protein assembly factor BamB